MAQAPVINPTQSVLCYLQRQSFGFQPYAANSPLLWSCSPLPAGLSFDSTTGAISGAVSLPGVYVFGLTASNSEGNSPTVKFYLGIEATSATSGSDLDLVFDVLTRQVSLETGIPPEGARAVATDPLLRARLNDDLICSVRLTKQGTVLDLEATAVTLTLKADDEEPAIETSTDFFRVGSGQNTRYRVAISLTNELLKAAVTGGAETLDALGQVRKTTLLALGEIVVKYPNPDADDLGPETLRIASDTFQVEVSRNYAP